MMTLKNLTAVASQDNVTAAPRNLPSHTQAAKGFQRRLRWTKDNLYLEASNGSQLAIPISEIWALAEAQEPNFKIPVANKPPNANITKANT